MDKKITAAALLTSLGVIGAMSLGGAVKANAEEVTPFEIENVFNWNDNASSYFDEDGAHAIRHAGSDLYANGIGLKQQLSVEDGQTATVTFQIPDYDHETRTLKENRVDVSKPYDIFLHNVDTNFDTRIRMWTSQTTDATKNQVWLQYCEAVTSSWETYSGGWIDGVLTDGSEFTISFDKVNWISAKQNGEMVKFTELGEIGGKADQFNTFMQQHYGDANRIEFWFAHEKLNQNTLNEVVIKSINGNSLCLNADGKFEDTVGPVAGKINVSKSGDFEMGAEYSLRVEKYINDPSTKADFVAHPSSDATTAIDDLVKNTVLLGKPQGFNEWTELGEMDSSACMIKKIRFNQGGQWDLKLKVTDNGQNSTEGAVTSITVKKGYSIELSGDVPSTWTVDTPLTLPSATATDENNVERQVAVKVEDPLGDIVPVAGYTFTPRTQGVYYVTYESSYTDAQQVKHTASKVEREIIVTKAASSSSQSSSQGGDTPTTGGCGGSIVGCAAIFGACAIALVSIVSKRKDD